MDRQLIYPGAIPLETDLLNTNKYAMMGLAKLSSALMGSNTYLHGLACTPSSPASMVVNVAKGQIYSVQNVDGSAYSSLAADTTNTILKQGIILGSTAFTLTAPTTAGQSINYLIQVAYNDVDSGATVLPYYNASNPSVAYSGPNNAGTAQNTVRSGVCTVALKAGVAATTGSQTTPVVDTGYTAAWVITVAQGATSITAANISVAPNAPFLPASGVYAAIQQGSMTYSADTGAANAYVAQFIPALPTPADGMRLTFKAKTANTGASTLAVNGGNAYPLYSHANQALQGGEIVANGLIEAEWNSSLTGWVMCGNSGGALPVAAATQSNHALQLGQAVGRLNGAPVVITASGTYTPRAGTNSIIAYLVGGGAAGGGTAAVSTGYASAGGGGGGGSQAVGFFTSGFSGINVTIGAGGLGSVGASGGGGGATSFGSLLSAGGGSGGSVGGSQASAYFYSNGQGSSSFSGNAIYTKKGNPGTVGQIFNTTTALGGAGGSSDYGQGGNNSGATAGGSYFYGSSAVGYGAGGGGGVACGGSPATKGGDGTAGIVIVWEYT